MNFSTLIGLTVALVVFGMSLVTSTDDVKMFLNGHAILIVIGGTASAALLCFPVKKVLTLLNVFFRRMVGKSNVNYGRVIEDIMKL
jgi:chemotaxis protein MotA